MRNIVCIAFSVLAGIAVGHAMVSFWHMDANAANWSHDARFTALFLYTSFAAMIGAATYRYSE
jgi:hypothetical protein